MKRVIMSEPTAKKRWLLYLFAALALSCRSPASAVEVRATSAARASNTFAFDLFERTRPREGNSVVSPASLAIALAMTATGARGETRAQILRVLRMARTDDAETAFPALLASLNGVAGK